MQPTAGTNCHTFHNLYGAFLTELEGAQNTIQKYAADPSFDIDTEINHFDEAHKKLMEGYKGEAKEIVKQWMLDVRPYHNKPLIDYMEVADNGRVVIHNTPDDHGTFSTGSSTDYFPRLIQKINTLWCRIESANLTNIDYLEEIGGSIDLHFIASAKRLRKVDGLLGVKSLQLHSLEALETTGSLAVSEVEHVIDFPKLKTVNSNVYVQRTRPEFPELETVGGELKWEPRNGEYVPFPKLSEVGEDIAIQLLTAKRFRDLLPGLRKVGADRNNTSLYLPSREMIGEVQGYISDGTLQCSGRVLIGRPL